MGENMDHPPLASLAMANQAAPSSDAPWALFDALQESLVYLGPAIRWEQDPTSSDFTSHSRDLPLYVSGSSIAHYTNNICTEAACPDATLFGYGARLCSRLLPAFPCDYQLAP